MQLDLSPGRFTARRAMRCDRLLSIILFALGVAITTPALAQVKMGALFLKEY